MYNKIDENILKSLEKIVGTENLITERDMLIDYAHDEYADNDFIYYPDVVVKPYSIEQVSKIVQLCNDKNVPLTPRGGGTGLCGGCVPVYGGIVLSLENMNKIKEIDSENLTATVESGVRLSDFYNAVEDKNLFFPPHPGDSSAMLGGIVATNAGGARAIKYGVVRNFVKGMKVVSGRGDIINLGGKYIKNSSGYNLLQLMIGSEGTLGIITEITFSLLPPVKSTLTLVIPFNELKQAISTVPLIMKNKIFPMAIEFIGRKPIELSSAMLSKNWPVSQGEFFFNYYCGWK